MLKLSVIGNLGSDPQIKEKDLSKMIKLNLGVGVRRKKETVTQWIDVLIFGNSFEKIMPLLVKGTRIYVFGTFDINHDPNTNKSYWNLIADAIHVLNNKKESQEDKFFSHTLKKEKATSFEDEIPF